MSKTTYIAFARNPGFGVEGSVECSNLREAKREARRIATDAGYGWVPEIDEDGMLPRKFLAGRWSV